MPGDDLGVHLAGFDFHAPRGAGHRFDQPANQPEIVVQVNRAAGMNEASDIRFARWGVGQDEGKVARLATQLHSASSLAASGTVPGGASWNQIPRPVAVGQSVATRHVGSLAGAVLAGR